MFFDDLLDGPVHKGRADPLRELIIDRINSGEQFYDPLTGEGGKVDSGGEGDEFQLPLNAPFQLILFFFIPFDQIPFIDRQDKTPPLFKFVAADARILV